MSFFQMETTGESTSSTPRQKLREALDRYLKLNDYNQASEKNLKDFIRISNKAIVSEGLIINNSLRAYLELITCKSSLKNQSPMDIVLDVADVFERSREVVTLIEFEIYEDNQEYIDKMMQREELAKYVEVAKKKLEADLQLLKELEDINELEAVKGN